MKTPLIKIIEACEDGEIKALAESLLDEERRIIEVAYANGYLMTKSAKEYYEDTYDRKQLTLFEDE